MASACSRHRRAAALLLALCAAAAMAAAPSSAQSLYRPISRAAGNFSCSEKLTRVLGKAITVSPRKLCQDFGMANANALTCTGLDIIDATTKRVTGDCLPHKQAPVKSTGADGKPIPVPLEDRRPLPATFGEGEKALLSHEGATMYWHVTNVINLFLWAPCKAAKDFKTPWRVPDGWTLLRMEHTPPQGPYDAPLPMYAVLRSADGRRLAVIIRGTRTAEEWQVDMTYLQIKDPAFPGKLSKGFALSAQYLWPGLEAELQKEVVEGAVEDVQISGHSLGAAIATLLSYRAQVFLDDKLPASGKKVAVGAMLFAPPNVGDPEFAAAFNRRVNARRVAFVYDFVPQVPCAPYMMACTDSIFPTTVDGTTQWPYSEVGGAITFGPEDMPVQPAVWAKTDTINGCMMLEWGIATHICSYPCLFSKYANAEDNGRCKLWGSPGEKQSLAFCNGFPHVDPEYPLKGHGSKVVVGSKPSDPTKPFEIVIG